MARMASAPSAVEGRFKNATLLRSSSLVGPRNLPRRGRLAPSSATAVAWPWNVPSTVSGTAEARQRKLHLLELVKTTGRGVRASRFLRGMIEEAQVGVEALGGSELQYELLPGMWRLQYTTAADVLPILEAESRLAPPFGPSPIQVGGIFQRFSGVEEGLIENIIQLSTPFLLQERDGVTITVKARYEVRSPHRISLTFEEAQIGNLRISEGLEAVLAPAMLPRTSLQHTLLLFLKEFKLRFPFNSARQLATRVAGNDSPGAAGGNYQLSFLDEDMLIGRASALGGSFIFTREPQDA